MKRLVPAGIAVLLSCFLIGCSSDTRPGLLTDVANNINKAASEIDLIKKRVKEATEKAQKGQKFDLSEAIKATDSLKDTGNEANRIKKNIDRLRTPLTEDEKKEYANKTKAQLNDAVTALVKNKEGLRKQMIEAEQLGTAAKLEVDKLREKLRDAESPFESLAR